MMNTEREMNIRTEILLMALAAVVLGCIAGWVAWDVSDGEAYLWPILLGVLCVAMLGMGALAWAGWGRWLLAGADADPESRRWWRLWFVPCVLWGVIFVARTVADEFDRHSADPDGTAMILSLLVMAAGAAAGLAVFFMVLIFGFREIGHLLRQRKARRRSG